MSEGPTPPGPAKWLTREMDDAGREFYRRLAEDGGPATTRCERCARTSFPPRLRCACGAATTWVELPSRGRLYAFTTMEGALRFRAPAVLALARLGDAVLPGIASAEYAELHIGQEVAVEPHLEPETGLTLLTFKPVG